MYRNASGRSLAEDIAAIALLLASLIALVALGYRGLFLPIDYDEAYNLQVVDNLAKGLGYASYGSLRGDGQWLFDPFITTGPAILGPLGLVWHITGGSLLALRSFMFLFLPVYLAGLYCLCDRKGTSFLVPALGISASLCITQLPAGRALGELPAATAIVWSAWAVTRDKPSLAGLASGLALQIKLVYGLAGAVMLTTWLISSASKSDANRLQRALLTGLFALVPTIVFEVFRFYSLGNVDAYFASLDELRSFLRTQNINNTGTWLQPNSLGQKIVGLYQLVQFYGWLSAGVFGALCFSGAARQIESWDNVPSHTSEKTRRNPNVLVPRFYSAGLIGLIFSGLAMLLGWITKSTQYGSRQGLPFALLFLPALFILGGHFHCEAVCRLPMGRTSSIRRLIGICGSFLLGAAVCFQIRGTLRDDSSVEVAEEQKRVSELITRSGAKSMFADGWWQNPEFQLLTGIPALPIKTGTSQMLVVQDYQVALTGSTWNRHRSKCSEVVYESPKTLVCWLPAFEPMGIDLHVLDWGPRSTPAGLVPNRQYDGGAGLWIKIERLDVERIGPVKVLFSGRPSNIDYLHPDGELITTTINAREFKKPGRHEVTIRQLATGRVFSVGEFEVGPNTGAP